ADAAACAVGTVVAAEGADAGEQPMSNEDSNEANSEAAMRSMAEPPAAMCARSPRSRPGTADERPPFADERRQSRPTNRRGAKDAKLRSRKQRTLIPPILAAP